MDPLKKLIKFEDMNAKYPEQEAKSFISAIEGGDPDLSYCIEKLRNIRNFYDRTLENTERRLKNNPECFRKMFCEK